MTKQERDNLEQLQAGYILFHSSIRGHLDYEVPFTITKSFSYGYHAIIRVPLTERSILVPEQWHHTYPEIYSCYWAVGGNIIELWLEGFLDSQFTLFGPPDDKLVDISTFTKTVIQTAIRAYEFNKPLTQKEQQRLDMSWGGHVTTPWSY